MLDWKILDYVLTCNCLFLSLLVKVSQDQARMALRKQVLKDAGDVPSRSHQIDDDTEEDEALEDDNVKKCEH